MSKTFQIIGCMIILHSFLKNMEKSRASEWTRARMVKRLHLYALKTQKRPKKPRINSQEPLLKEKPLSLTTIRLKSIDKFWLKKPLIKQTLTSIVHKRTDLMISNGMTSRIIQIWSRLSHNCWIFFNSKTRLEIIDITWDRVEEDRFDMVVAFIINQSLSQVTLLRLTQSKLVKFINRNIKASVHQCQELLQTNQTLVNHSTVLWIIQIDIFSKQASFCHQSPIEIHIWKNKLEISSLILSV